MSAIAIDVTDAISLAELVARLKRNQEIIITASNEPVAKLTSVGKSMDEKSDQKRQSGLTKGAAWMSPDFNEPLEDFAEYMP